jgi:hypothetical protein
MAPASDAGADAKAGDAARTAQDAAAHRAARVLMSFIGSPPNSGLEWTNISTGLHCDGLVLSAGLTTFVATIYICQAASQAIAKDF